MNSDHTEKLDKSYNHKEGLKRYMSIVAKKKVSSSNSSGKIIDSLNKELRPQKRAAITQNAVKLFKCFDLEGNQDELLNGDEGEKIGRVLKDLNLKQNNVALMIAKQAREQILADKQVQLFSLYKKNNPFNFIEKQRQRSALKGFRSHKITEYG